ncbi:MAG: hypothetical protein ACKVSF_16260 [Alphaproteobacteria bacterium]
MRQIVLAALSLALACASGEALAAPAGRNEGQQVCDTALAHYRQSTQLIEQNVGITDAEVQIATLRQSYVTNLILSQLMAMNMLQWFNCELPKQVLAKVPELNMGAYATKETPGQAQATAAAQSEAKLRRNRSRILEALRDVGSINALPAGCAGSSSFAASDMRSLYDFLYQAGYSTGDVDYFRQQYDKVFDEQIKVTRATIKSSGFENVCGRDMVTETRKGFDKIEQIKSMFR